ncbi:hypothetical protein FGG08_000751 [Glutinoglossum americanum]|uniref:Dynactin subunit 5 n=1 Tax=Glutinoglossum americanum TaxID=1670608 RepID=A0A9P8I8E2_9PEZI|nr:hypothetical protein FGG08_000751 [Glutinoglossum americanum]
MQNEKCATATPDDTYISGNLQAMPPKVAKGEYIETDTGNKVSRKSNIFGTQHIILGGKTIIQADCTIRGDLYRTTPPSSSSSTTTTTTSSSSSSQTSSTTTATATSTTGNPNIAIAIGRYCILSPRSLLRPPSKIYRGIHSHYPLKLGDHVFIGPDSIIEAAVIGSYVHIGAGSVVGKFVIIKDCVKVLDGTVIPQGMVIPSFSIVAGRPARVVDEVPETGQEMMDLREVYRKI